VKSLVDDAPTRERVAASLLEHGPSTTAELAERLDLTPAAVRRHLDRLVDDGVIGERERRVYGTRGRGRPAREYRLTEAGHDGFVHTYDALAAEALHYIAEAAGPEGVSAFARGRLAELEDRLHGTMQIVDAAARPAALADTLTQEGYAASADEVAGGVQICQHHCPVAHVAEEFPQLCEAETEMFARVLGIHVQRLATIAHGDGVCTTHLPTISQLQEKR
jgi:predicted ArsR family transcriptional regulator